ncbi:MAG: hypothetical protein C4589_06885 [Peptococcaceae bacterium]|nr:MAG: hypothetical protein C4589_06885 [Peptococcaceae bacterium]
MELLPVLKKRMGLILLLPLVASVAAAIFSFAAAPVYEARATLLLTRTSDQNNGGGLDYNTLMMFRQLARTYGELAKSSPVIEKLAEQVNNELSLDDLREMVVVRKIKDLELIQICVRDRIPGRAVFLANKLTVLLLEEEARLWQTNNLQVVSPAFQPSEPVWPNILRNVLLAGFAGLATSILGLIAWQRFAEVGMV